MAFTTYSVWVVLTGGGGRCGQQGHLLQGQLAFHPTGITNFGSAREETATRDDSWNFRRRREREKDALLHRVAPQMATGRRSGAFESHRVFLLFLTFLRLELILKWIN
jgi:hypothetical protein